MAASNYPGLTIQYWRTGLYTYRSQLFAPLRELGINVVQMRDALIDGQDMEVTDKLEVSRRPGYVRMCSQQLAANEIINQFYSDRGWPNVSVNNLYSWFDSNQRFAFFTSSAITTVWTKPSAAQAFVEMIGSQAYIFNGTANGAKRFSTLDHTLHNLGIPAPANAPTVIPPTGANIGSTFWQPSTSYVQGMGDLGQIIVDYNGNVQQNTSAATGTTGTVIPNWLTQISQHTVDNQVTWDCLGTIGTWAASTQYAGSVVILDSNGNIQQNQTPNGTTGAAQPTWNTNVNGNTTDNTITWKNLGNGQFQAFTGWVYVYTYSTQAPTVAGGYYHCSTASPPSITTGPVLGTNYTISLTGAFSTSPECNSVDVYRTRDGGSYLEYLGSVANNQAGGTWTFTHGADNDSILNPQIIVPLGSSHINDPPPGSTGSVAPSTDNLGYVSYWNGRLWCAAGNKIYFDAGPDCTNGDPHASWPPANVFAFNGQVIAHKPTSEGLLVFLADAVKMIAGGPATLSYFPADLFENFGISSANCLDKDGDVIRVLNTQGQYWQLTVSEKTQDSKLIADVMALNFAPATSYLTSHHSTLDDGVFLSDGSTNQFRYGLNIGAWSPLGKPIGGIRALRSIETSIGTYTLCMARASAQGYILGRSLTTWQDDGQMYSNCFSTVGNIVLSQPLEPLVPVRWITLYMAGGGGVPTLEVLPNEISGVSGNIPSAWSSSTNYTTGQQVTYNNLVWQATQNSTNQTPSVTSAFWQFVAWAITFTPVPNPVVDLGMRDPISLLVRSWNLYNVQTLRDSLMMHHLQVKITFPQENFPSTIKVLALGSEKA